LVEGCKFLSVKHNFCLLGRCRDGDELGGLICISCSWKSEWKQWKLHRDRQGFKDGSTIN